MRRFPHAGLLLLVSAAGLTPGASRAQDDSDIEAAPPRPAYRAADPALDDNLGAAVPPPARRAAQNAGGPSYDRFEAIRMVRQSLQADPNNVGDWVILGELARQAAANLPAEQDDAYYRLSREAYERALRLAPADTRLQAAARSARASEAGAARIDQNRVQAARVYLDARRRAVAAAGYGASAQADDPLDDGSDPTPAPRRRPTASRAAAPVDPQADPSYGAVPRARAVPGQNPNTLRGLAEQLPGVLLNEVTGGTPAPR